MFVLVLVLVFELLGRTMIGCIRPERRMDSASCSRVLSSILRRGWYLFGTIELMRMERMPVSVVSGTASEGALSSVLGPVVDPVVVLIVDMGVRFGLGSIDENELSFAL